jgi:uncharacterized protein YfaS (alpha-2-macroglobulin family)
MQKWNPSNLSSMGIKAISILVILSSLLAGCRLPWVSSPQETEEFQNAEEQTPPTSTPEPRDDLPPALVEVTPLPNSVIALQQPISLYFNQPMDKPSVEAAVRFDPSISGRFTWEDDQTLTFTPDQTLISGSTLNLALDTSAQAVNRKNLQNPIEINYSASSYLEVIQVVPSGNARDVDPESLIFVTFNQPVISLGAEAESQPGFTLSPEVPGDGAWLNTSTYTFQPETSLGGGTQYTLTINPGLTSTFGSGLNPDEDLQYQFTTTQPEVIKILPLPSERLSLDGPLEVYFNIRMDPQSVAENLSLIDSEGNPVPGQLEWDEDYQVANFIPNTDLERNETYTFRLEAEAESMGGLPINEAFITSRVTYPSLALDSSALPEFTSYYSGYGQYHISFTGPLNLETYKDFIQVEPELPSLAIYANMGKNIFISGYFDPETTYSVTLKRGLEDQWGGRLGEDITNSFFTPPAEPVLNMVTGWSYSNMLFTPSSVSELALQATNINTLDLAVSPISLDDLMTLLHPDNYGYRQVFTPDNLDVTTHSLSLPRNMNQVVKIPLNYLGESLSPGIYYLGLSTPDIGQDNYQHNQKYYLIVSDNNLVMKIAPSEVFVWGTKLEDYSPLGDAPLAIYTTEGELVASGTTNVEGTFEGEKAQPKQPYASYFVITGEPGQDDFGFSISSWNNEYNLYEMGIKLVSEIQDLEAYIYTDRPIYRPGDEVYFKVAIFSRDNGLPTTSELGQITVTVTGDPGMTGIPAVLYSESLDLNPYGMVDDSVSLPENATPGIYNINILYDEQTISSVNFDVAAYRKPQIEVDLTLEKEDLLAGEGFSVEALADTYFGMPVSDQPYYWTLFRKDSYFNLPGYFVGPSNTDWLMPQFPMDGQFGIAVDRGEGMTNDAGYLQLDLTEKNLDLNNVPIGSTQSFTFELSVSEESGFTVSNRDSILVHPEEFYIGVQPEAYFGSAETPFSFSLKTVDWDRQPVGNISIEAIFETIDWEYENVGDPAMPYQFIPVTSIVASASPITGQDGEARVTFTPPDPGTYQLTVRSGDALTEVLIWVGGTGMAAWPRQGQNRIELIADADSYQPGQIAQVFVPNPFGEGAKALVTVERAEIMSSQIVELNRAGEMISIPISSESIPNIYVSLTLLGKTTNGLPDYRQGLINLPIPPLQKTLSVDLRLDKEITEPGETVTAVMKITDPQGNPVQGEFSVGMVDKAVLALADPNSKSIIEAFYGEQPLSVRTSHSLKTYAVSLLLSAMDLGIGGGGGDGMEAKTVREDFPDTAFWRANVITGSDGTAKFEIPLPDSLTTWVLAVRGLTENYLVGEGEAEIVTQKAIMIQPLTPRFLVDGDQVEMAADVYNNTTETLDIDVSLQAVGFVLMNTTNQTQTVRIEPGKSSHVSWVGKVESVEEVDLVFQAVSGDRHDASAPLWGDLEVKRYAMPLTMSTAGQMKEEGQRLELISLPVSTDPSSGELSVVLNPSLTSTLVDTLEEMETVPYNDTITIISQLLSNLNGYLALRDLGIKSPQLEENLQSQVKTEINQILEAQNFDGGWSWWAGDGLSESMSDPFVTAYVVIGLDQAIAAGLTVGEGFITQAKDYLSGVIDSPRNLSSGWMLDRWVFLTYALRKDNPGLMPMINQVYSRRSELSPWAQALLSLTIHHGDGSDDRIRTILNDLESNAIRSATGVYWETLNLTWNLPGTPNFNTAVVLFAMSQLDPASESLPAALQYLMINRSGENLGDSPLESAWMLMGITGALKGTGDFQADFDFRAALNDVIIAEGTVEGTIPLNPVESNSPMTVLYPDSPNTLLISRGEGSGTLYYRADLQAFQPAASSAAINKGISIERSYYIAGQDCLNNAKCDPIEGITLVTDGSPQIINVGVTLTVAHDMVNFMVEDYIPAGTEIINQRLLTTQTLPEEDFLLYDPRDPFDDGWGWWYFGEPQIYDDHILWTAEFLPAGTYTLTYQLLPFTKGVFQVIPAHAWQYYYPEVMGTSAGELFIID